MTAAKKPVVPPTRAQVVREWAKIKEFTLVVVEWHDAFSQPSTQYACPKDALDGYRPCVRRSTGYWCGTNDDVVAFATDDDRSSDDRQAVGGLNFVPIDMVKRVEPIGETKVTFKR